MMKHLKKTLLLVLIGAQYLVQSQTMTINGLVSNKLTGNPISGQTLYFNTFTNGDSIMTRTNDQGTFTISLELNSQDTIGVEVITYDPCNYSALFRYIPQSETAPYVHFEVCGDTMPPLDCLASFGYSNVGRDSLNYPDSTETVPLTVWFYDYSIGNPTQWAWDFGDGFTSGEQNPVHEYAAAGIYDVMLNISSDDCNSVAYSSVYVGEWPEDTIPEPECQAYFWYQNSPVDSVYTTDNSEMENTVYFYDYSYGSPTSWQWDFGDGQSSVEQSPIHQYDQAGNYIVNLSITTSTCQSTYASMVYVGTGPIDSVPYIEYMALFYPIISPDLTVTFINQSVGNLTNYTWDFGDGSTSNDMYPVHTYATAGDYLVTLKAFVYDSLADVYEMMIGVGYSGTDSTPNAYFIPLFNGLEVTFLEIAPYNVVLRNWNFGDGKTSSEQDPTNLYPNLGLFDVRLDAGGFNGSNTSFTMRIDLATQTYSGFFNSSEVLGINDQSESLIEPSVYPNPVEESATIEFECAKSDLVTIEICNLAGQIISNQLFDAKNGDNKVSINTDQMRQGLYVVKLKSNSQQYSAVLISK